MKNADKTAMPTSPNSHDPEWAAARVGGLTKREHFAAMAMQGLLSNSDWVEDALEREGEGFYSALKHVAYTAADKMLEDE